MKKGLKEVLAIGVVCIVLFAVLSMFLAKV